MYRSIKSLYKAFFHVEIVFGQKSDFVPVSAQNVSPPSNLYQELYSVFEPLVICNTIKLR